MTKIKRLFVTIIAFINSDDEEILIESLDPTLVDEKDMNFDRPISKFYKNTEHTYY